MKAPEGKVGLSDGGRPMTEQEIEAQRQERQKKAIPELPFLIPEEIAEMAHENNNVLRRLLGQELSPSWADYDPSLKEAAVNAVEAHLKQDLSPKEAHALWMQSRLDDGWTYGPVKDDTAKVHPNLRDYRDLGIGEKLKDYMFAMMVRAVRECSKDHFRMNKSDESSEK